MTKRALAILTAFCLAVGTFFVPSGAQLICRMSGEVMVPQVQGKGMPCCQVEPKGDAVVLSKSGCCDLRQGHKQIVTASIIADSPAFPPVVITHVTLLLPPVATAFVALPIPIVNVEGARPPPLTSLSPRAPPVPNFA